MLLDRFAPINCPAESYFLPQVLSIWIGCTYTRKKQLLSFVSRADFVNLIGAVRVGAHHARSLLRAVWAQTGEARGK